MASLYVVTTGSVATTVSSTKSLLLLNPASGGFNVTRYSVSLAASASSATVAIQLYRTVTIGSPGGTTATLVKLNPSTAATSVTGLTALSAEPSTVEVLEEYEIQPFGGVLIVDNPLGREHMAAAAGSRIGIRYITPAAVNPNMRAYMTYEEQ